MANSNDNPRRDHPRPEDNPFIAFRRFADSQVSSLLNTVFTLPATIANYNNAHQAREQCLFGKADKRQCDKLRDIEEDIAELRHEGRELFRVGDIQAVLRNSEELMRLDRKAEEVRKDIVGQPVGSSTGEDVSKMVEKVGNQKGQEFGWMWDWGFPRPFDHDNRNSSGTSEEVMEREWAQLEAMMRLQSEARRLAAEFEDKAWDDPVTEVAKFNNYIESQTENGKPRAWSWSKSWQWPPPADASHADDLYSPSALEQNQEMDRAGVSWRAAYEDLIRAERKERLHCMRSDGPMSGIPGRPKIPISQQQLEDAMEDHDETMCPAPGIWGRSKIPITQQQLEETMEQNDKPNCPAPGMWARKKIPITQQQLEEVMEYDEEPSCPAPGVWERRKIPITQQRLEESMNRRDEPTCPRLDEPSYEYSHDHEDQHDDPPTPKQEHFATSRHHTAKGEDWEQEHETEMDAYERLEAASAPAPAPSPTQIFPSSTAQNEAKPSILSTLTTTERTVAPDGSVTTKVVLKKRFADGREESSETVHTQRGQEDAHTREPWRALPTPAQASPVEDNGDQGKKKSGWFWSS
jgi:hypothetical protein